MRRLRRGNISSWLPMFSGGVRSILFFPRVTRCLETMYIVHVCFYVCCSDGVGVHGKVCCVVALVKDSVLALGC